MILRKKQTHFPEVSCILPWKEIVLAEPSAIHLHMLQQKISALTISLTFAIYLQNKPTSSITSLPIATRPYHQDQQTYGRTRSTTRRKGRVEL